MEVVSLLGGAVGAREVDVVEREGAAAAVMIGIVAAASEGNFAVEAFGEVGFVEPAVKVVGGLDGILAGDVFREGVVVSVPSVDRVRISRDGETVGAELIFDDALKGAGSAELAHGPFELAVWVVTVVLALVPVANRKSNRLGIAKRSNFP